LNYSGADEAELEKALKASMETFKKEDREAAGEGGMVGTVINPGAGGNKEPEKPSFEAFQGVGH
jgi:hypothetical protein